MPFEVASPKVIRDRIAAELETLFDGADPRNRRSVEQALARALTIASRELHGHVAWAAKQRFAADCDEDFLPLHASLCRPPVVRAAALTAAGTIAISGEGGETLPAGSEFRRADDTRYTTNADVTLDNSGNAVVAVRAAAPGSLGNAASGTRLTLIAPVIGISSVAQVVSITGGSNIEAVESWRHRIIEAQQADADGGNGGDYKRWVQDVVGRTRVWVWPNHLGLGTVGISFVMPDGSIPDAGTIAAVTEHLNLLKPVTAVLYVFAPGVTLVDFEIALTPNSLANQAAVTAELADILIREAEPGGTLPLSRVRAAISSVDGEYSHDLISPVEPITTETGYIARLGAIDWVA